MIPKNLDQVEGESQNLTIHVWECGEERFGGVMYLIMAYKW